MMDRYPSSADLISPSPAKDLATIFHLCNIYSDGLQRIAQTDVCTLSSSVKGNPLLLLILIGSIVCKCVCMFA